jgi:YD repeat-containing protein
MTWDGRFVYTWDAENRMTGALSNGLALVSNAYDYQGRRIRKSTGSSTNTFVYDGWNLYREVETSDGAAVTNIYIWGLDLSGTLQGAGGVGGLLAVLRNGTPYFPCYDANGNITDYMNATGTIVAHREYDPFGSTTVATVRSSTISISGFPPSISTRRRGSTTTAIASIRRC